MTAIVFPTTLPNPSVSSVSPNERRILSDVTGGPQQARGVQLDYLGLQRLEWSIVSATDAASLDSWWKTTLTYGGAWFSSTWPCPQGWVSVARRFVGAPQWSHLPGGFWRVTAQVQVRGLGVTPAYSSQSITWSASDISSPWTLSSDLKTATAGATAANFGARCTAYVGTGKRYFEVLASVNAAAVSAQQACFGLVTSAYVANSSTTLWNGLNMWALLRNGTGEANSIAGANSLATGVTSTPTIFMIAIDFTTGNLWWGQAGSWASVGRPTSDPGTALYPMFTNVTPPVTFAATADATSGNNWSIAPRFTGREFTYTVPTGYQPFGELP